MPIRLPVVMRVSRLGAFALIPTLLSAHPGHEGGHELIWEFAGHPYGSVGLAGSLLALGIAGAWWLSRSKARPQPPAA